MDEDKMEAAMGKDVCGVLVQYPATDGTISDYKVCVCVGWGGAASQHCLRACGVHRISGCGVGVPSMHVCARLCLHACPALRSLPLCCPSRTHSCCTHAARE